MYELLNMQKAAEFRPKMKFCLDYSGDEKMNSLGSVEMVTRISMERQILILTQTFFSSFHGNQHIYLGVPK